MFRKFQSRLGAALAFASYEAQAKIADGLNLAIQQAAALPRADEVAEKMAASVPRPRKEKQRSIRKGTQSRFHAKRGNAFTARQNHEDANNKAFQFLSNTLLVRLLGSQKLVGGDA